MARAPPCHGGGRGFKSRHSRLTIKLLRMNKEANHSVKKALTCSLVQFVSFVGLIILANAGLRSFLETRTDFEPLVQVAIRIIILVVLIALVYPQFRGSGRCYTTRRCDEAKRCRDKKMMHEKKEKEMKEEKEEKEEPEKSEETES